MIKWFPRPKKEQRQRDQEEVARNRADAEKKLDEGRDRLARLVQQMTNERQNP
ncbi:hypothetical protein [Pseudooceanicola atlanticus]|uniref:hypothetical protein n=1 Tax=Pseudooceanicola atlanticus TaxID=1461694 RepID=UPI002356E986|nr:hypothetical protein [Pseudooceanicola atlanticus]